MATQTTLRNGDIVSLPHTVAVGLQLKELDKTNPTLLWDLAMKCKNASHYICPTPVCDGEAVLKNLKLLNEDGSIHGDVKTIVLNSVANISEIERNPMGLQLQEPFAPPIQLPTAQRRPDIPLGLSGRCVVL